MYVHVCLAARSLMCFETSILRFRAPYVRELEHCRCLVGGRSIGALTRALALWAPRGGATCRGRGLGCTGGTLSRPRVPVLALRGSETPVCPAPEACAQPLPLHRAGLRWLALYPGWAPEIFLIAVVAAALLCCCARRGASRRIQRRPVVKYEGRIVPAARVRPALLG